jgi:ubiquinone/menaquinone biosynthesis C-methylase UbiE
MSTRPQDAWSLYWAAGNLDSCIPARQGGQEEASPLRELWVELARSLPDAADVLDLATGNGAVALAMAQANPSLRITGVDRADIDPAATLTDLPELAGIHFHPRVDVASLPFDPGSFDVITSQFGVEYASLPEAVGEALSVVRSGGSLHFVLHHADSDVVAPAGALREEIGSLMDRRGPVPTLIAFVSGSTDVDSLEQSGERHLKADVRRTRRITGHVYKMVNAIVEQLGPNPQQARIMTGVLAARLEAESERLKQLQAAALDAAAARRLRALIEAQGAAVRHLDELRLPMGEEDEALIGWRLHAQRTD